MNKLLENYQFRGYSFQELIECFELGVNQAVAFVDLSDGVTLEFTPFVFEEVQKMIYVNNNKVTFTLVDEEEIELEKLRQFLWNNCNNNIVIEKVREFLLALVIESEKFDDNYPVFYGILKIKSNEVFIKWVTNNLEYMWS